MRIFHTVNAGLYIEFQSGNILVDGIHRGADVGLSDMPAVLLHDLEKREGIFRDVRNLLFTHLHPDHFDKERMLRFLKANAPEVYGPGLKESTVQPVPLENGFEKITMNGITALAIRAPHEGELFQKVDNRSYFLFPEGSSVFIAGDSILSPHFADLFFGMVQHDVDYAFFNPYQLICKQTRSFLYQLRPKRLFLYHLPLEKDDTYRLHSIARSAVKELDAGCPPVNWLHPISWIDLP